MSVAHEIDLTHLVEIERIKQLKAQYASALEHRRWDDWAELFTHDAVAQFAPSPGDDVAPVHRGREALRAFVGPALAGTLAIMRVTQPEITIVDDTTARGTWALTERLSFAAGPLQELTNFGQYDEAYRKEPDGWRIAHLVITRLRQDTVDRDGKTTSTIDTNLDGTN
jgi:ketosteroid isomerase-like protein